MLSSKQSDNKCIVYYPKKMYHILISTRVVGNSEDLGCQQMLGAHFARDPNQLWT